MIPPTGPRALCLRAGHRSPQNSVNDAATFVIGVAEMCRMGCADANNLTLN